MAQKKNSTMEKTTKAMCRKCTHCWSQAAGEYSVMCHYVLDTGKRRNCPIGYCDKFEPKKRKRREENEI